MTHSIEVRLDERTMAQLRQLAIDEDRTPSAQIRYLVRQHFARSPIEAPTTFSVRLEAVGERQIMVIKEVRSATSLSLREAKEKTDAVRSGRPVHFDGFTLTDANAFVARLREAGAIARVIS